MEHHVPLVSAADITTDWLTQAVQSHGMDGRVVDFTAAPLGTGQVAVTKRFALKYDRDDAELPRSLIGKFTSEDSAVAETGSSLGIYRSEVMFYRELAHRTRIRTPEVYAAEIDEDGRFCLLLEDLSPARPGNQLTRCTLEETRNGLIEAAKLNAAFWNDASLPAHEWLYVPEHAQGFYTTAGIEQAWSHVQQTYEGALEKDVIEVCEQYVAAHEYWNRPRAGAKCLTHNDFRQDNMLFWQGGQVALVDWQTVSFLAAGMDPAYFLSGALDREVRADHEAELLELYYETLLSHGVSTYPFDRFVFDYRHYTFATLAVAIAATVLVARTERGDRMLMGMITDGAHHVLDSGALDLLEDCRATR